ncbi:unnamed protein product [Prunus armeniaca]|uniref:Uncharacterized protein n=1 Tax=Prunus armeniaca TaxID=36596 RepID=A0A6J5TJM2_PRUAR|nr:unnamed protein product [Prunus armeniaca]
MKGIVIAILLSLRSIDLRLIPSNNKDYNIQGGLLTVWMVILLMLHRAWVAKSPQGCCGSFIEDLPIFALQDDRVVEVVGDAVGVHKAIELIVRVCIGKDTCI